MGYDYGLRLWATIMGYDYGSNNILKKNTPDILRCAT
jgi:hypothetical protein